MDLCRDIARLTRLSSKHRAEYGADILPRLALRAGAGAGQEKKPLRFGGAASNIMRYESKQKQMT